MKTHDLNWDAGKDGARKGDWLQTYTAEAFWPLDPRASEVNISDISHALSNTCRYTGHVARFYSVAEHSVIVSHYVPKEHALWGLLHDAPEAYIADLARPVKRNIPEYSVIERAIMVAVAERFGLSMPEPEAVKEIDNRILHDERKELMPGHPPRSWGLEHLAPLGCYIRALAPPDAKALFMHRFNQLYTGA